MQGHDIPLVGLPFKKKRGRKPKNYQSVLDEQLIELNNSILSKISFLKKYKIELAVLTNKIFVLELFQDQLNRQHNHTVYRLY